MAKKKTNKQDLLACETCGSALQLTKLTIDGKSGSYLQCPTCNTLKFVGGDKPKEGNAQQQEKVVPYKAPPEARKRYGIDEKWYDETLFLFCERHGCDVASFAYANRELLSNKAGVFNPKFFTALKPGTKFTIPQQTGYFNFNAGVAFMAQFPEESQTKYEELTSHQEWNPDSQ